MKKIEGTSEQLRAENERLQRRLQAAEDRIEVLKHQTHLELIHVYPDQQPSPPPQPANIPDAPNAELIGSKRSGASDERIRRSVAAIKDFNEGKPQSEHIAINAGSLRKLARGNAQTINAWVKEHKDELEAYATEHGHGYRQNVGKDYRSSSGMKTLTEPMSGQRAISSATNLKCRDGLLRLVN